jgi:Tfp pilus assembly protein FimT
MCTVKVNSFTLIELITVIIIMAFVMSIGIPAFSGMFKGQAVGNSTATTAQLLKLSRSYAISNHQYIAVIIPQAKYPSSGIPEKYYSTTLRPAVVTQDSPGKFIFTKWLDGEAWTLLQPGTAILEMDDDANPVGRKPSIRYVSIVDNVDFSDIGGSSTVNKVSAIVFKFDGVASSANENNFTLDIGRGAMTPAGLKVLSDGKPMQIEISTTTGMIFVEK